MRYEDHALCFTIQGLRMPHNFSSIFGIAFLRTVQVLKKHFCRKQNKKKGLLTKILKIKEKSYGIPRQCIVKNTLPASQSMAWGCRTIFL
jgi:hypothetical protein